MTNNESISPPSYWSRLRVRLKNSFWKRYGKVQKWRSLREEKKAEIQPVTMIKTEADKYQLFSREVYAASQFKPALKAGYIARGQKSIDASKLGVKAIAFYLPQFHPIAENDAWWGKGFTEWSSVTRAAPQFLGHYQPRLPGDLGFYDLRLPEVMRQQVDLAKDYGIYGFCFHHYWFGGKRLLEMPVRKFLADKDLTIKFCLCWANENWSRRWDGSENEVLMAQQHSPEDDIAFIDDLIPSFKDERYIRVDGKPLLIVYRATLLPDIAATAARWRKRVQEHGISDLYLVAALSFEVQNPVGFGFDAGVEFPPHQVSAEEITHQKKILNPDFSGKIYDYREVARSAGRINSTQFVRHKTVMPSWDNCARKLGAAHIFADSNPQDYARWLNDAVNITLAHPEHQRLLFVNAWNEWGEGTCLEPDRRYGYANISATANVLSRTYRDEEVESFIEDSNRNFAKKNFTAVVLHLYFEELLDELTEKYLCHAKEADIFVTVSNSISIQKLREIKALFPNVYLIATENRGRDVYPFLLALRKMTSLGYEVACKLHTKKSLHMLEGDQWRDRLMSSLLGGATAIASMSEVFRKKGKLGILAPQKSLMDLSHPDVHVDNRRWLDELLTRIGCADRIGKYDFEFPAGSMFWFRVNALRPLLDLNIGLDDFEYETGQIDGTLAHALERLISIVASKQGYVSREVGSTKS